MIGIPGWVGFAVLLICLVYISSNLLTSVGGEDKGSFGVLGGLVMSPSFADLRHMTTLSGCSEGILEIDSGSSLGCDHWGRRGLGYPPMIFFLARAIGVSEFHTEGLALVIAWSFLVIITARYWRVFTRKGWLGILVCIAVYMGLPTQLGLERMNIDLAVFSVMFLLTSLIVKTGGRCEARLMLRVAILILVGLLSLIISGAKIYPGIGLILWLLYNGGRKELLRLEAVSSFVGATGGLTIGLVWLLNGSRAAAPGIGLITHGLYLGHGQSPLSMTEIGLALATFFAALGYGFNWYRKQDTRYVLRLFSPFASLTFLSWAACFIVGPSFDYRLILLVPSICELYAYSFSNDGKASIVVVSNKYFRLTSKLVTVGYIATTMSPLIYFTNESSTKDLVISSPGIWNVSSLILKYIGFYSTRMGDIFGLPFICATLLVLMYAGRPRHIAN